MMVQKLLEAEGPHMSAMGFVLGSFRGHKRAGVDRWPPCGYCLPAGFCKRTSSSHRSQGPREHQAGEQGVVIRQHSQWVGRWTGISESEDPMMLEKQHRELRVRIPVRWVAMVLAR